MELNIFLNGFYWFESILPFIYWSQIRSIGHKSFKGLTIGHESDDESRPTFIGHLQCRSFQAAWKRTTIVTIKIVYQWLSKTKHIDRGTQAWVDRGTQAWPWDSSLSLKAWVLGRDRYYTSGKENSYCTLSVKSVSFITIPTN